MTRGSSTGPLAGRVAIVTGSGRGIGHAIARRLAVDGASVVVCQRSLPGAQAVARELCDAGARACALAVDVCDEASVQTLVNDALSAYGRIDIMCNNAGTGVARSAMDTTVGDFRDVLHTNVLGPLLCVKHAAPHMPAAAGASIVNVGSVAGLAGLTDNATYCASKGAVVTLTKQMALDLAPRGIRVNCVCPGFVETDQMRAFLASRPDPERAEADAVALHPLGRLGHPTDVAGAVAFLVSDDASFVTGATLAVDGGYLAR